MELTVVKAKHVDYGISEELSKVILATLCKSELFIRNNLNMVIVEEINNPIINTNLTTVHQRASEHASRHAECKALAYSVYTSKILLSLLQCLFELHGSASPKPEDRRGETLSTSVTKQCL